MLENMKLMGALAGLMKNKDKLREAGERVRTRMQEARVVGEAGSGAARAVVSGTMRVVSVELAPALVTGMAADDRTRTLAATLIADAVNDALQQAQVKMKAAIDEEAKSLGFENGLPDLAGLAGLA